MSIAISDPDYSNPLMKSVSVLNFGHAGIAHRRQVPLPVLYKDVRLDCGYRLDVLVENELILEIKAVERILPIHEAQMLTYLKLSGFARSVC